jgi:ankyrin repeat protein
LDTVQVLVASGADIAALDVFGNTASAVALEHDRGDVASFLRSYGA